MEISTQIIQKNGTKEFVVIPYEEFLELKETLEDYEDLMDLREAKKVSQNEQSYSFDEAKKMLGI